jgi:hypothetical protein
MPYIPVVSTQPILDGVLRWMFLATATHTFLRSHLDLRFALDEYWRLNQVRGVRVDSSRRFCVVMAILLTITLDALILSLFRTIVGSRIVARAAEAKKILLQNRPNTARRRKVYRENDDEMAEDYAA